MSADFDFDEKPSRRRNRDRDDDDDRPRRSRRREDGRRKPSAISPVWGIFLAWCGAVAWYWLETPVNAIQEMRHNSLCLTAVGIGFAIAFAVEKMTKKG